MLSAAEIVKMHDQRTIAWHRSPPVSSEASTETKTQHANYETELLALIARQHHANFELWHIEDEARIPGATEADLADVKRRVDATNQRRNDLSEEIDRTLLLWLESRGLPNPNAPLHSESPGLIIDRLSILALKIYHTREEAEREGAPHGHERRNRERLAILEQQRTDLASCLDALWRETLAGSRRFKLYLQLKMYNDPTLNPAVYRRLVKEQAG